MESKIFKIAILVFLPLMISAQTTMDVFKPELGKRIGVCEVCNMDIFEKMMTRVEILVDDTIYHACGIGCAIAIMEGKAVKDAKVIDFKTFKQIDMKKTWFVTGSVIFPARAMLPVFSFSSEKDADDFVKVYGGQVFDYQEMVKIVEEIQKKKAK